MAEHRNEQPVYSRNRGLSYYAVYNADNQVLYEGWANPGSSTGSAVWQVCRHTWVSGNLTRTEWAGGSDDFQNIMDNYLSLAYS